MIYKQKRSGIFHNWTITVNPGFKYVEFFAGELLGKGWKLKMSFQVFLSN